MLRKKIPLRLDRLRKADELFKEHKWAQHCERYANFCSLAGQMDDDEFKESCMTPGNQNLYQVMYPEDIDEFNRILGTTDGRRDLLVNLGIIRYVDGMTSTDDEMIDIED